MANNTTTRHYSLNDTDEEEAIAEITEQPMVMSNR